MELLEVQRETRFLGREFLTWLWFRSETAPVFKIEGFGTLQVLLGDRIELSGDPELPADFVTVRGEGATLREARSALREGKLVSSVKWKFNLDGEEWDMTLDELWLSPRSLKVPRIEMPEGDESDPDAILLERIYLIERALQALDALLAEFVTTRAGSSWERSVLPAIHTWIGSGPEE